MRFLSRASERRNGRRPGIVPARRFVFFMVVLLSLALTAAGAEGAETSPVPGLSVSRLDNGLDVFLYESHVVPLVRIQITFRCGSITQTPATAGLFHLYEHMLFKGNATYKNESDVNAAMTRLGVANWNGGTSSEYVTYYFTIPSSRLADGLDFWAAAIRTPLLDGKELETEKDVVINEIRGYFDDPDEIFDSGITTALFSKYPWRRDVTGSEQNVRNATVAMLREIKDTWYIPNNAAVFIGGDIDPARARELVDRSFGSWAAGADPWAVRNPAHPAIGREKSYIYADESMMKGMARATLRWRGPDVLTDPKAAWTADVWTALIENPSGRFKTSVFNALPGLYQKDYISGYYLTQRDGGSVNFDSYLFADPKSSTTMLAQQFKETVKGELTAIVESTGKKKEYFSASDFEVARNKLEDQQLLERETPETLIANLSFWWASAGTDYYFFYVPNVKRVGMADISSFIDRYILKHEAVVAVRMNAGDYVAEKPKAARLGFSPLTKANAFWWKK